jgi:hypothetical protein
MSLTGGGRRQSREYGQSTTTRKHSAYARIPF